MPCHQTHIGHPQYPPTLKQIRLRNLPHHQLHHMNVNSQDVVKILRTLFFSGRTSGHPIRTSSLGVSWKTPKSVLRGCPVRVSWGFRVFSRRSSGHIFRTPFQDIFSRVSIRTLWCLEDTFTSWYTIWTSWRFMHVLTTSLASWKTSWKCNTYPEERLEISMCLENDSTSWRVSWKIVYVLKITSRLERRLENTTCILKYQCVILLSSDRLENDVAPTPLEVCHENETCVLKY